MVDVVVLEVDSIAPHKVYSSAGALIDLGIYDLNIIGQKCIDAHVSAAVKAHLFDFDFLTFIEIKNSTGAKALLLGMACRET